MKRPAATDGPTPESPVALSFWNGIASDGLGGLFGGRNAGTTVTDTVVDVLVEFTDVGIGEKDLVRRLKSCNCGFNIPEINGNSHDDVTVFI